PAGQAHQTNPSMVMEQWLVRRLGQGSLEQSLGRREVAPGVGGLARLVEIGHAGGCARRADQKKPKRQGQDDRAPDHGSSALRSIQLMPSGTRTLVTVSTLSLTPLNQSSWLHSTP